MKHPLFQYGVQWPAFLMVLFATVSLAQTPDLPLEGAGLVVYNRIATEIGDIPTSVVYLRGDFRENGQAYLWPRLEPAPGQYDFSAITQALDESQRQGLKLGFRILTAHPNVPPNHPEFPFFPSWIPFKSVTRENRTAFAPDWDNPEVQDAIHNLLLALGDAVRDHSALLFVDVGVLGWVGEWHTFNGFQNGDFMPTLENMKRYVDFHIEAFGADKLLIQLLDAPPEVVAYGLSKGINGVRQDCFGATYHMQQYEFVLQQVPALAEVIETGMVFFEVCGLMDQWTHQPDDPNLVTLPIEAIIDRAIRWKTTMWGTLGLPVPARYRDEFMRLQQAMAGYWPKNQ